MTVMSLRVKNPRHVDGLHSSLSNESARSCNRNICDVDDNRKQLAKSIVVNYSIVYPDNPFVTGGSLLLESCFLSLMHNVLQDLLPAGWLYAREPDFCVTPLTFDGLLIFPDMRVLSLQSSCR
ncbi:hypothetical protein STEG23_021895 [Scotinomys teguina]